MWTTYGGLIDKATAERLASYRARLEKTAKAFARDEEGCVVGIQTRRVDRKNFIPSLLVARPHTIIPLSVLRGMDRRRAFAEVRVPDDKACRDFVKVVEKRSCASPDTEFEMFTDSEEIACLEREQVIVLLRAVLREYRHAMDDDVSEDVLAVLAMLEK